ncbi:hypothetical protein ACM66B_005627 [Microbotryomycetes sp. NB124-2]
MTYQPFQGVTASHNSQQQAPVWSSNGFASPVLHRNARHGLPPLPGQISTLQHVKDHSSQTMSTQASSNQTNLTYATVTSSAALEQHHSQLVAYYWHYAQQGWLAPVINGDPMQQRARDEAADWARAHGIQLFEPAQSTIAESGTMTGQETVAPMAFVSNASRPLPSAPASPTPRHVTSLQAAPVRSHSVDSTIDAALSQATSSRRPLPCPPARANTAPMQGGSAVVDDLSDKFQGASISSSVPITVTVPVFVEPADDAEPGVPAFSFSVDNDDDDKDSTSPGMPSIALPDDMDGPAASSSSSIASQPSKPRLHPRFDPSHPSHFLYHPKSTPSTLEAGTVSCSGCQKTMFGKALMAMGLTWHPACFKCVEPGCGQLLEHVQFDGQGAEVYCMVHYEERFMDECYHCKTRIAEADFIKIEDPLLLPPLPVRTYHALHFFCSNCGEPFVDPTLLAKGKVEHTLSRDYVVEKGWAYCEECHVKLFRPKCRGCRKGVRDEWIEVDDGQSVFHPDCFVCEVCRKPLSSTYLVRSEPASDQDQSIKGREKVEMIERVYCVACFDETAKTEAHEAVEQAK